MRVPVRRWQRQACVVGIIACAVAMAVIARPGKANSQDQGHYALPFGANPYLPSNATAEFSGFLDPKLVPSAAYCANCHQEAHKQWRESAHANSFREPFYIKNVQVLIDTKGIEYTRHCEGCHNPTALFSGALTKGSR